MGGTLKGETEYWDEFIHPEDETVLTKTVIQFGKSFDPVIKEKNKLAKKMDLKQIAAESYPGGKLDIKKDFVNVGGLLNGKYVTSRSAGNYIAGYNAEGGRYFLTWVSFETFQKMAGALHVRGSNLTDTEKGLIWSGKLHYGSAPTYGEEYYQYRMSKKGWDQAEKE